MRLLLIAALVAASTANAQRAASAPGDLETLQRLDQYERAIRASDQLQEQVNRMSAERNMACMKAVGARAFCSCLTDNLPIAWSFPDYVAITSGAKGANGYDKMDKEMRKAYDAVPAVRDRCVRESFGGKR